MAKAKATQVAEGAKLVTLKISLKGVKPPIWRRVMVSGSVTLGGLSEVILAAMGWHGSHLHVFAVDGRDYSEPGMLDHVADEERLTLNGVVKRGVRRFTYTYDMGDNWQHIIAIEKTKPADPAVSYPSCIAGARNSPPEDCGGIWGYRELLETIADPDHPERDERLEWIGGNNFDPEDFNLDVVNSRLAAIGDGADPCPAPS